MKNSETLSKALDLLQAKGWTQGTYARNAKGERCDPTGENATCYCSYGAIISTAGKFQGTLLLEAYDPLRAAIGTDIIAGWNDSKSRTKEEVFAAFEKAIEIAKAAEGVGQ